jgi:hypothetical protein
LESIASGPSLETFIATERNASPSFAKRSVFGWEATVAKASSN